MGDLEVLVYEETPRPAMRADAVLIQVHAASVNPVDWKTRRGAGFAHLLPEFPMTLGWEVSGRVVAVSSENSPFREGDDVYNHAISWLTCCCCNCFNFQQPLRLKCLGNDDGQCWVSRT